MAKKTATKNVKKASLKNFWPQPGGDFVSAAVLLALAYVLGSLAIDSGSLLQWLGTIVALGWAIGRLAQGAKEVFRK